MTRLAGGRLGLQHKKKCNTKKIVSLFSNVGGITLWYYSIVSITVYYLHQYNFAFSILPAHPSDYIT